jgi:hypothetical protein
MKRESFFFPALNNCVVSRDAPFRLPWHPLTFDESGLPGNRAHAIRAGIGNTRIKGLERGRGFMVDQPMAPLTGQDALGPREG